MPNIYLSNLFVTGFGLKAEFFSFSMLLFKKIKDENEGYRFSQRCVLTVILASTDVPRISMFDNNASFSQILLVRALGRLNCFPIYSSK